MTDTLSISPHTAATSATKNTARQIVCKIISMFTTKEKERAEGELLVGVVVCVLLPEA